MIEFKKPTTALAKTYLEVTKQLKDCADERGLDYEVLKTDILDEIDPYNLINPLQQTRLFLRRAKEIINIHNES